MAERKAVNKYYPVEWDPSKGSINAFQGVHALRDRARKLHMGIMIIRFEMPYNVWCEGCGAHIGMGVRFNAEKKKAGNYYSTTIYSFRMKCHLCSNWMEIHTDPKNAQYVCVSGVRKKEEYTDACGIILQSDEEILKRKENAFYRLEHGVQDEVVAKERVPHLTQLLGLSQRDWQNPYETSRKLRRKFRVGHDISC
jgi:coiled-coil domain-containing protein 130